LIWEIKSILLVIAVLLSQVYNESEFPTDCQNAQSGKDKVPKNVRLSRMLLIRVLPVISGLFLLLMEGGGTKAISDALEEGPGGHCFYKITDCGMVDMYQPLFNGTDPCASEYASFIGTRELSRVTRDFVLFGIMFSLIENKRQWKVWADYVEMGAFGVGVLLLVIPPLVARYCGGTCPGREKQPLLPQ
jgi:hypothetical protein